MRKCLIVGCLIGVASISSIAAEQIAGLSPSSRSEIEVYDSPSASQATRKAAASDMTFPIDIQGSQTGFLKILIDGKPGWVKSTQVRVKRDVTASCGGSVDRVERVGSTPGAGGNACK